MIVMEIGKSAPKPEKSNSQRSREYRQSVSRRPDRDGKIEITTSGGRKVRVNFNDPSIEELEAILSSPFMKLKYEERQAFRKRARQLREYTLRRVRQITHSFRKQILNMQDLLKNNERIVITRTSIMVQAERFGEIQNTMGEETTS